MPDTQRSNGSVISTAEPISIDDLYLDPENPRLVGENLSINDQEAILQILWEERSVDEIVDSIAASAYWGHEVLFATKEEGKFVVVEGNRRLAAVKLLVDPNLRKPVGASGIPRIQESLRRSLQTLPVIITNREALWDYIGFKHVNGPQDWDSIAKAQYIARVHNKYHIPLDKIASTIGDKHNTVKRLYRGLMVLNQAENSGVFDVEDRYNKRFAYSHLWTGVGYTGIRNFLGIIPKKEYTPTPVPQKKLSELGELCLWLYGSKSKHKAPLVKSQNPDLRYLDEALQSKDGEAALRSELGIEVALKISRGENRLLRESLVLAEQTLREVRGLVLDGYEGEEDLIRKAEAIHLLSDRILDEMREMYSSITGKPYRKR